ncbi:hypothetical protein DYB25_010078, partial [Aphanomyces astaci]
LLKIMECMKGHDKAAAIAAVQSLRRLFLYFAEKGELKGMSILISSILPLLTISYVTVPSHVEDADPISAYSKWLWEHYVAFLSSVIAWISEDDEALQVTALRTAMEIVAQQGTYKGLQSDTAFGNETFVRVVRQLVSAPDVKTSEVLSVFKGEYLNAYTDVQYFTITIPTSDDDVMPFLVAPRKSPAVDVAVGDDTPDGSTKRSISDSSSSGPDKKKAKTDPSLYDLREHQRVFSVCWIALLKHKLSTVPMVLANLPDKIMPFLAEPLLLADFLTDSYNVGGITSLLALNSLFVLIQQYNFDCPAFFTKLYQLLADDTLLRSKYRLSRLALTAEPGAILFIIPCVYNLVLRHKECLQLIHRTTTLSVADRAAEKREMLTMKNHIDAAAKEISKTSTRIELSGGQDPFDNDTNDPLVCHALKSSLWELFSLKQHYHAGVATKAKIFEEKLRSQMIDLADDVDISYASLVDDALKRREKQHVALAFEPCVSVLTPTDPIAQIFAL